MKVIWITLLATLSLFACKSQGTSSPVPETEVTSDGSKEFRLQELWRSDTLLNTCESVLYHEAQDLLYVSCIQGTPSEKDGKGYIALLDTEGKIRELKWIEGLDAPKGMGIYKDHLFVTNIDHVLVIDLNTATIMEKVEVDGASFLNDIAVDQDGTLYFTDSDTGILWKYRDGACIPWIKEGLDRPNGLLIEEDRVLLSSSGSEDLKIIDKQSGAFKSVTPDIGHGDGLVYTGHEGYYLTSNWSGEIFLIHPDYSKTSLLQTSELGMNTADMGFNPEKQVVYVPTFFDNRVIAYKLMP